MPGVIEKSEKLLAAFDDLYFSLMGQGLFAITYSFEYTTVDQLVYTINRWNGKE